jgi:hypothetical protein
MSPGRILVQTIRKKDGYVQLPLSKGGVVARAYIHQLVAKAFHGNRPLGMDAAHDNGNKADNRADNIEWKTRKENNLDRIRHNTLAHGERHGQSRFTVRKVMLARKLKQQSIPERKIAARVGVSRWTLRDMLRGRTWVRVRKTSSR